MKHILMARRIVQEEMLNKLHMDSSRYAKEVKKEYEMLSKQSFYDSCTEFYIKRNTLLIAKNKGIEKITQYHNVEFRLDVNPYEEGLKTGEYAISYAHEECGRIRHPAIIGLTKKKLLELAADLDELTEYTVYYKDINDNLHFATNLKNATLQLKIKKWENIAMKEVMIYENVY